MNNFTYRNPTTIIFGKGVLNELGAKVRPLGKRALLVYGKSSARKYGTYDLVFRQLKDAGIEVFELGGVQENPLLGLAREGVSLAKNHGIDFIIGMGGGSAIDTAKVIAAGAKTEADIWDIFSRKAAISQALKIAAIVTIPAAASEANAVAVLTNEELGLKAGITDAHLYPEMAFLDPALTQTLPLKTTANTAVDIMAHVMETYLTSRETFSPVQDGYAEGICKAVTASMDILLENPQDYDARASLMWAALLAWNGLGQLGINGATVPCHMMGYPLSGNYNTVHGATLAILLPAWLRLNRDAVGPRIEKFGSAVFGANGAEASIVALVDFYKKIGAPVSMSEAGIKDPDIDKLSEQAALAARLRGVPGITKELAAQVYKLAL